MSRIRQIMLSNNSLTISGCFWISKDSKSIICWRSRGSTSSKACEEKLKSFCTLKPMLAEIILKISRKNTIGHPRVISRYRGWSCSWSTSKHVSKWIPTQLKEIIGCFGGLLLLKTEISGWKRERKYMRIRCT